MNSKANDKAANLATASRYIDEAVKLHQANVVVVPEFFNTEYYFQYRDYAFIDNAEPSDGPTITAMREKARQHRIHVIATIHETAAAGNYYDTAHVIDPAGEIVGKYRKTHPAAVRSLEKIYFRYGSKFPVVQIDEFKVGFVICYDTLFPESARCATLNGAELIIIPFASPTLPGWDCLMRTPALENGVYLAPCNKVGPEGDWVFGGQSMIVDPFGSIVVAAGGESDEIISAELDRDQVFEARRRYPMLRDRRPDLYRHIVTDTEDLLPGV
jgi:N-carbamoylputrescine amidase